jgi:hypothetical protein
MSNKITRAMQLEARGEGKAVNHGKGWCRVDGSFCTRTTAPIIRRMVSAVSMNKRDGYTYQQRRDYLGAAKCFDGQEKLP